MQGQSEDLTPFGLLPTFSSRDEASASTLRLRCSAGRAEARRRDWPPGAERTTAMRWRERIRSERGSIARGAPRSSGEMDLGFDPDEYPHLAKAARDWSESRTSRLEKLRKKMRP